MKFSFTNFEKQSEVYEESYGSERKVVWKSMMYRGIKIYCRYQLYKQGDSNWQERSEDYSFDLVDYIEEIEEVLRQTKKMGL